jgi:hypothetical protein
MQQAKTGFTGLIRNFFSSSDVPEGPEVPGFRHKTGDPEYARLALPFCRQDSIRKLAVLLEEESTRVNGDTQRNSSR